MAFGEVFGRSWGEYKKNFKAISLIALVFLAIPGLVYSLYRLYALGPVYALGLNRTIDSALYTPAGAGALIISFIIAVLMILLMMAGTIALVLTPLKKEKFSFSDTIPLIKKNYLRYLGFMIVFALFMVLLFLALIVPGIIFAVYWMFAAFVFLGEGKGIMDSLGESYRIVKGKWWRVLGNVVLLGLVLIVAALVFAIPSGAFISPYFEAIVAGDFTSSAVSNYVVSNAITNAVQSLLVTPFTILFFKNLYLDFKKRKEGKSK